MGAVLQQYVDEVWVSLEFFSQKLRAPERQYSAFDHELLALYLSVQYFRHLLEGRQFIAFTDHKPLTHCMSKVSTPWSNRQQCQLAHILEFTTDICHIKGKENPVADTPSRETLFNVHLGIDYNAMAKAQQQDPEVHTTASKLQINFWNRWSDAVV